MRHREWEARSLRMDSPTLGKHPMKKRILFGTHLLTAILASTVGVLCATQMIPSLRQQYTDDLAMSIHILFDEHGQAREATDLRRRISLQIANSLQLSVDSPGRSEAEFERLKALSSRVIEQDLLRYLEEKDARHNALDRAMYMTGNETTSSMSR